MTIYLSIELFFAVWSILLNTGKLAAIKHLYGAEGPVVLGLKASKLVVDAIQAGQVEPEVHHGKQMIRVTITNSALDEHAVSYCPDCGGCLCHECDCSPVIKHDEQYCEQCGSCLCPTCACNHTSPTGEVCTHCGGFVDTDCLCS